MQQFSENVIRQATTSGLNSFDLMRLKYKNQWDIMTQSIIKIAGQKIHLRATLVWLPGFNWIWVQSNLLSLQFSFTEKASMPR